VLERGQIEGLAGQEPPRIRLPEPGALFSARAARLRELAAEGAIGHSIADYLHLMAALAETQHRVLEDFTPHALPGEAALARGRAHGMPVLDGDVLRDREWQDVLVRLCDALEAAAQPPASVRQMLGRLRAAPADALDRQADAILAGRTADVDVAAAPFVAAALQVRLGALASRLTRESVEGAGAPGVCPVCGTLPVASIVREDSTSQ